MTKNEGELNEIGEAVYRPGPDTERSATAKMLLVSGYFVAGRGVDERDLKTGVELETRNLVTG